MPYSNLNEDRALNETWDGGVGGVWGRRTVWWESVKEIENKTR